jgi:hypothetical protein
MIAKNLYSVPNGTDNYRGCCSYFMPSLRDKKNIKAISLLTGTTFRKEKAHVLSGINNPFVTRDPYYLFLPLRGKNCNI